MTDNTSKRSPTEPDRPPESPVSDSARPARETPETEAVDAQPRAGERSEPAEIEDRSDGEPAPPRGRPAEPATPRAMLVELLRPRASRAQVAVGVLCLLLGFAAAAQVRSNSGDGRFATARQEELVGVLDNLSQRSLRLRSDVRELEQTKAGLERDGQGDTAADEARRRATTYGLLAGTIPATGPGIELFIADPNGKVRAGVLLDTLQELRDAGAEVVQINDVRVGVETFFVDAPSRGITVDHNALGPPYRFLVIGEPRTLAAALDIPGGVMETLRDTGATGRVTQRDVVEINAVRSPGKGRPGTGD